MLVSRLTSFGSKLAVPGLVIVGFVGCSGGDGTHYSGRILDARQFVPAQPPGTVQQLGPQWGVHLLLDGGKEIIGSDDIFISVPADELECTDGAPAGTRSPVVGGVVDFIRRGNDADASSPPGVGARSVVVDCAVGG